MTRTFTHWRDFNPKREYEETYHLSRNGLPERAMRTIFVGSQEEQQEAFDRMRLGLMCSECNEVFPCQPSLENLKRFRDEYYLPHVPSEIRDVGYARIAAGLCPQCGWLVDGRMFELQFQGIEEPSVPENG